MTEENLIEKILEKTMEGKLVWKLPKFPSGVELEKQGTFYVAELPTIDDEERILLFIVKSISKDNTYSLLALQGDKIMIIIKNSDISNEYLLRSLFDCASEETNKKVINKLNDKLDDDVSNSVENPSDQPE